MDAAQKSSTCLLCSLQVLLQLVHLVLVEHHIVDFQGDFLLLTFDSRLQLLDGLTGAELIHSILVGLQLLSLLLNEISLFLQHQCQFLDFLLHLIVLGFCSLDIQISTDKLARLDSLTVFRRYWPGGSPAAAGGGRAMPQMTCNSDSIPIGHLSSSSRGSKRSLHL